MSINLYTPQDRLQEIAHQFKERRLSLNLTQEGVANRSGVSWGSVKRFESTGQVSLESLLKIALVLDCLDDFKNVGAIDPNLEGRPLESILKDGKKKRLKGALK